MKICSKCEKEFNPSSGHKMCPSCRNKSYRAKCKCGKEIKKSSNSCALCHNKAGKSAKPDGHKTYIKKRVCNDEGSWSSKIIY